MPAIEIDLSRINLAAIGLTAWAVKADAKAALDQLREKGWNATGREEIHRADNRFFRFWLIGRPDPLSEFTWLMNRDGSWRRGRLVDQYDKPPVWEFWPTPEPIPPTFTHITSTVPYGRTERYRTKSNGSCGRWVMSDDSVARCTCGWKSYESTRGEAQAAARYHRANPGNQPVAMALAAVSNVQEGRQA